MQFLSSYFKISLFLFCFLFISCQREDVNEIENSGMTAPQILYYHDIQLIGRVKTENDQPLYGTIISCDQTITTTSEQGLFLLRNVKTNKAGQIVKYSHPSFYDEYRFFITDAGDVQSQSIRLSKLENPVILNGNDLEVLKLDQNAEIHIPPTSFMTINGEIYIGKVKLYFRRIQSLSFMPVEKLNYEKQILDASNTYQFVAFTENNETLILKNNVKVVTMSGFTVATLNEARALWQEEKNTTLNNQFFTDIDHLNIISIGRLTDFAFIEATLNDDNGNVLSNVKLTLDTGNNEGEIQSSQTGKIRSFFPSNVTATLSYSPKIGGNVQLARYNLPKGKHQADPLLLKDNKTVELYSKLKLCGNGELSDEEMVSLLITSPVYEDFILFQTEKEQTFYTPNEYDEAKATYFASAKQIYSISKKIGNEQRFEFSNDNFCISDLIGYLKIDGDIKYFNENQISILKEDDNAISITDNIGFLLSFDNPKLDIPLNPTVLLISNPNNIVCDQNNCTNIVATFEEVSSVGNKVKLNLKGSSGGHAIEGNFEGILK